MAPALYRSLGEDGGCYINQRIEWSQMANRDKIQYIIFFTLYLAFTKHKFSTWFTLSLLTVAKREI